MTQDQVVSLVVDAMSVSLKIALPVLLVSLVVGLAVSIFQAVTQIQEQTLSFIPKIVAMVAAAILLMPWTAQRLMDYSREMFTSGLMN